MLKWIKRKIQDWLKEDDVEETPSLYLELTEIKDGQIVRVEAFSVCGVFLNCWDVRGSQRLIRDSEVRDPEHYWKIWKHFMGDSKLIAENGNVVDPSRK